MYSYYTCSVALPRGAMVGLQCVIVVFPDHTHFLGKRLTEVIYHGTWKKSNDKWLSYSVHSRGQTDGWTDR